MLQTVLSSAKGQGAGPELYRVAGKQTEPCDACGHCFKTGVCRIDDDMQELYRKMMEADGIVSGSPVYFYNTTAQGKAAIDRTIICLHRFALGMDLDLGLSSGSLGQYRKLA